MEKMYRQRIIQMNIYRIVKKRVQSSNIEKLTKQLGYASSHKTTQIIKSFLNSKDLYSWLHRGYYDLTYTSEEFLKKLCLIFNVDYSDIENALKKEEVYYQEVARIQKNYIRVNTNFKRKNEPIFALACLEHTRDIRLEVKKALFKDKSEVLKIVSETIQKHYKETNGRLNIWGVIVEYIYYHDDEIFTFGTDGKLINKRITNDC